MRRRKVLQVLYSGLGGHGSVAFSLLKADSEKRFNHQLLFYGIEEVRGEYVRECERRGIRYETVVKEPGDHFSSFYRLFRKIRTLMPDVVLVHSSNALIPALFYRLSVWTRSIRVVFVEHEANEVKTGAEWFLSRVAMRFADRVVVISDSYRKRLQRRLGRGFRSDKVRVIPNGLDLETYPSHDGRRSGETFTFTMAARLVEPRDHPTLITAFRLFAEREDAEDLRLVIAGDGELEERLVEHARMEGVEGRVEFAGLLDEEEMIRLYGETDVYVHATLGETMSTSIMQALASGLPMIVSDIPGTRHMLTDGETALLVPPEDPEAMAGKMRELYGDEALRRRLSREARRYAEEHLSADLMFERYAEVIENGEGVRTHGHE